MRVFVFFAFLCTAFSATAQDSGGQGSLVSNIQKTVEMPAHRSLLAKMTEPEAKLAPFETDGCSGGLSTTWTIVADLLPGFAQAHKNRPPWEACCVAHDRHYHRAGGVLSADASYDARLAADEELRACVVAGGQTRIAPLAKQYNVSREQVSLAYKAIGDAMFNAVRFGGAPCSGLPWRWGYGFAGCVPFLE